MKVRNTIIKTVFPVIIICSIVINLAFARSVGYVFSEKGEYLKIDILTNKILTKGKLYGVQFIESDYGNIVYDEKNNRVFVVDSFRGIQKIFAYDLKNLLFLKKLNLQSNKIEEEYLMRLVALPTKSLLYVKWWDKSLNNGSGGLVVSLINTSSFDLISNFPNIILSDKLFISNDGSKIYSCSDEEGSAKCDILNCNDLTIIKSINLEEIITPGIYGRSIDDFKSDKILIVENHKKLSTESDNYVLYTVDLNSEIVSPKILTNTEGEAFLFPDGRTVAFNETRDASNTSLGDIISKGRIHLFDLITGKEIGTINLRETYIGKILGVSQDEKKLYFYISNETGTESKIIIIDLEKNATLGELSAPNNSNFMIFYEE
jgi:hypothetical protein